MKKILVLLVLVLLPVSAFSADADCQDQFLSGHQPVSVTTPSTFLCFGQFATLYSHAKRTPVWSAEHLTTARLQAASALKRPNPGPFHTEDGVPKDARANLVDYHSASDTFDRGHMAPNGDMPDADAQYSSFSLANMVPQQACNNELIWEEIETSVRNLAKSDGEVYVVTGPIYDVSPPQTIGKHQVAVPTRLFKAIYDPKRKAGGVYITPNDASQAWSVISLADLKAATGIDPFPDLTPTQKTTADHLPDPSKATFSCRLKP